MYKQLVLFGLLAITACSSPDSSVMDETQEWSFALSNPVTSPFNPTPLKVGDRLEIMGDSLLITNEFALEKKKLQLSEVQNLPDSINAFTVEPGFGQTLRVSHFYDKELRHEWVFEPAPADLQRVKDGELTGKSFHACFPGEDTLRVYFDYGSKLPIRNKKEAEFYVSGETHSRIPKSVVMSSAVQRSLSSPFNRKPMREVSFYHLISKMKRPGFDRYQYAYGWRKDGTLIASYIDDDGTAYQRVELPLVPAPPVLPADVSDAEFAERINAGRITIDNSYPTVDSVMVAYNHQEDFYQWGGIEYDELSELELSLNEQGEFIIYSRGRIVKLQKWKLSKDRSYIHLWKEKGYGDTYLPILSWDDDAVTFRMPMKVKTREPRGMELESYANLDAFVRIEAVTAATSSK